MTCLLCHLIWSTKHRLPLIPLDRQDDILGYIGGILKSRQARLLCAGGTEDHVHLLISYAPNVDISKIVNVVKSNSSGWIHKVFGHLRDFAWQEGYGAFSVSVSQKDRVMKYIRDQAKHHEKQSFKEEFIGFLVKHRVEYDEKYVWD